MRNAEFKEFVESIDMKGDKLFYQLDNKLNKLASGGKPDISILKNHTLFEIKCFEEFIKRIGVKTGQEYLASRSNKYLDTINAVIESHTGNTVKFKSIKEATIFINNIK